MMLEYIALFLASAALALLLGYPVRSIALLLDVVDQPEKRKMHTIPMPLMGGLAIYTAFATISILYFTILQPIQGATMQSFMGLMAGATVVILLGIYDDVVGVKASTKFAGQTLAALVVVAMGARIDWFTNPLGDSFHLGWLGIPVAVLWIVGVTNAVNLIDGLDGLASGIGGIAAFGIFAVAAPLNPYVACVAIILAGSIFGFLKHNFYPARLFLGDTGSMLIGFLLAVIGLNGSLKATTATMLFFPIIILGVPILDTLFAILRRAKQRVSPFKADREHIHHRLVRIGLHHQSVVLVMYFVSAYLALTAYSISQLPYRTALLFVVLLIMGGVLGLRTIRFIEDKLEARGAESGFVPSASASRKSGPAKAGSGAFGTLLCEVGGFRDGFEHMTALRESLCADISSMLSRRVRVHGVQAEPLGRGQVLLMLKTEPMKPSMAALVQDGVAWYLEEHSAQFSGGTEFPAIHWIRTPKSPRRAGEAPQQPSLGARREGRAGLVSS